MGKNTNHSGGGRNARTVAVSLLNRIEGDGAYANLVLASVDLPERSAPLITELVYGVTRMRRALDHLIDGFVADPPDLGTRNLLRIGAYQLHMMDVPAYAAVSETVRASPSHRRGFVNAVLRRVAELDPVWPTDAVRMSYPDWMVKRLEADLGSADAHAALERMNRPVAVAVRPDGYVQDRASQWVAELVDVQPGERVLDMCAGPGGKATAMAGSSAAVAVERYRHWAAVVASDSVVSPLTQKASGMAGSSAAVVAADRRRHRASLVVANAARLGVPLAGVVVADGRQPPFRSGVFDRVLVDAPCSGLGVLGRRADARWRVNPEDVEELARLQAGLLRTAFRLVRPGGVVVYSVCTMTEAETVAMDDFVAREHPDAVPVGIDDARWRPRGRGALVLPQDHNTDGMFIAIYKTSGDHSPPPD
ncbi:transcription antitermination factor NusB [Candidatus Poriferisocius sp.]|uniref:transcription antitermination factor NusB n=1 Tax=Candidatus Poriferisocius sp. TaxID=3101276 RepID=UPI003B027102